MPQNNCTLLYTFVGRTIVTSPHWHQHSVYCALRHIYIEVVIGGADLRRYRPHRTRIRQSSTQHVFEFEFFPQTISFQHQLL